MIIVASPLLLFIVESESSKIWETPESPSIFKPPHSFFAT